MDLTCFSWVQIIKKSDLPANAKYLALYLSTFMNLEHDIAWPSQIRISNETGLSRSTAVKWLNYLEENGFLLKKSKAHVVMTAGGPQQQNEYIIQIPEKVVRETATLLQNYNKGCPSVDQRMSGCLSKDVRQPDTNNNRTNNRINHMQKSNQLTKKPSTGSWDEWQAWGKANSLPAKRGESMSEYVARLKNL